MIDEYSDSDWDNDSDLYNEYYLYRDYDESEEPHEQKISFHLDDLDRIFPEGAERLKILEELQRTWSCFVENNAVARNSYPYDLGKNELWICATNPYAKNSFMKSKGTIARRIAKRFGYDLGKDFVLTITDSIPKPKIPAKPKTVQTKIVVDEEKVRQYMQDAPDTLPDDINYAISYLQALAEQKAKLKLQ